MYYWLKYHPKQIIIPLTYKFGGWNPFLIFFLEDANFHAFFLNWISCRYYKMIQLNRFRWIEFLYKIKICCNALMQFPKKSKPHNREVLDIYSDSFGVLCMCSAIDKLLETAYNRYRSLRWLLLTTLCFCHRSTCSEHIKANLLGPI